MVVVKLPITGLCGVVYKERFSFFEEKQEDFSGDLFPIFRVFLFILSVLSLGVLGPKPQSSRR